MRAKYSLSAVLLLLLLASFGCDQLLTRSDAQIAGDVQGKITSDSAVPTKQITIQAANGVVTLTGTVASESERAAAANDAAQVRGVKTVVNNLQVGAPTTAAQMTQTPAPQSEPAPPVASAPAPRASVSPRPARHVSRPVERTRDYSQRASNVPNISSGGYRNSEPPMPTMAPTPPPAPVRVTVPDGTQLSVRLVDAIDTERNKPGDVFKATLDSPVVVDDQVVIPADADVEGRIAQAQNAGHYAGQSQLALELTRISFSGHTYDIRTDQYSRQASSRGKRTAETVGGGAALGAIIGGIAAGGKGAAIGAAAGAGAGTATEAVTKPQPVRLPAESLLTFRLDSPVTVTPANISNRDAVRRRLEPQNPPQNRQ